MFENIEWEQLRQVLTYNSNEPMIFSSGLFLMLFLGVSFIYMLLQKKDTARIAFITLFSYYFYYKSSGTYFFLLAIVSISDYHLARKIFMSESQKTKKLCMWSSVMLNLGLLCYFKYTNFLLESFATLFEGEFEPLDIFLPVGISFFTFQSMSYTIDIYRGNLKPLGRLLDYMFYVSFFPQLVAGPIVRAKDFIPQIRKPLAVTQEMFGKGVFLIMAGVLKKAVISDYISVNYVERIFDNPSLYSGIENLIGVYGYTLQIYCDFSGYSDMAIGIALLLGFHFPDNFNSPYKSINVTEFWKRWHISLSSWLKDYLYISLGGNRNGRTNINLVLTMLLGGLWHGASWNFIVWGGLHGVALVIHKKWAKLRGKQKGERSHGILRLTGTLITFHFVAFCWIFFRCQDFQDSWSMLTQIFTDFRPGLFMPVVTAYWTVMAMMLVGYLMQFMPDKMMERGQKMVTRMPLLIQAVCVVMVIYLVIQMKSSEVQPFIYFQF